MFGIPPGVGRIGQNFFGIGPACLWEQGDSSQVSAEAGGISQNSLGTGKDWLEFILKQTGVGRIPSEEGGIDPKALRSRQK